MNTKKKVYEALANNTNKVNLSLVIELDNAYQSLKSNIDRFNTDATRLDSVAKELIEYRRGIEDLSNEFKGQFSELNSVLDNINSYQYELLTIIGEAQNKTQELGVSMTDLFPDFKEANSLVEWKVEENLSNDVLNEASDMNLI